MAAGTVILRVPQDLYQRLTELARQERTDVVELLERLTSTAAGSEPAVTTVAFQQLLERADDLGVSDLSEQHDHYLYGSDKR